MISDSPMNPPATTGPHDPRKPAPIAPFNIPFISRICPLSSSTVTCSTSRFFSPNASRKCENAARPKIQLHQGILRLRAIVLAPFHFPVRSLSALVRHIPAIPKNGRNSTSDIGKPLSNRLIRYKHSLQKCPKKPKKGAQ